MIFWNLSVLDNTSLVVYYQLFGWLFLVALSSRNENEKKALPSGDINPGVKTAIDCQYLPSCPIHADQFFHCLIHDV